MHHRYIFVISYHFNEYLFLNLAKEEFDDSEMLDKIVEKDEKISGDDEKIPKKKGRPGRKKGKYYIPTINIKYSKFMVFY